MKVIIPNIEAERVRNGLSIEELSVLIGICRKTYHNWKRNGEIPDKKLKELAKLFNVSADYLLDSKGR